MKRGLFSWFAQQNRPREIRWSKSADGAIARHERGEPEVTRRRSAKRGGRPPG